MALSLKILKSFLFAGFLLAVVFYVQSMPQGAWTGFVYFYGLGWPVFISMCRLVVRSGAVDLKNRRDLFIFSLVVFGVLFFTLLHAFWIYMSLNTPYKGV